MVRNDELPEMGKATQQLAQALQEEIRAKGLTQTDVGEIIGRAQSYASLRFKGMKPWSIEELDKIAVALNYENLFDLIHSIQQRVEAKQTKFPQAASPVPKKLTQKEIEELKMAANYDANRDIEAETPYE